jgi:transposase-like protein
MGGKPYTPVFDHALMLTYYRQGMSDPEIARKIGCTASNVYRWRKTNGLEPNVPPRGGYGRPKRKRDPEPEPSPPPPKPTVREERRDLQKECSRCVYLQFLSNGMADTYCAYGTITGRPRITLPPREDGRCPGFLEAVPGMREAADD